MDYKGPIEAALSSDLRGEPYNFSLWDIHTGTQLVQFKGNKSNPIPKCLHLIDNNYFITANDNVIHVWSIFNRKCQDKKLFLPGRPSTLCISPCGNYLVVGIAEMIYLWQIRSGNLLAHTQRHYQTISALKMNYEGTFLFSGGEDGIVLVWPFADLISQTHNTGALNLKKHGADIGVNEPRFTWQHHSAQVTDIHVTNGGRCLSVSVDMSVNIYSYVDGQRLYSVTMPSPLWSVLMDKNETLVFLGSQDGNIYTIPVSSISISLMNATNDNHDEPIKPIFTGHKGKVINLALSTDGSRLISASTDSSCKIWDTRQHKLIQDIKHQAPLANLTTLLVPEALALSSMTQSQIKPPLLFKQLQRNLYKQPREGTVMAEDLFEEGSTTIVHIKNKPQLSFKKPQPLLQNGTTTMQPKPSSDQKPPAGQDDSKTVHYLKTKIKDLYLLSAEKIFCDAAASSLKQFKPLVDP